MTNAVLGLRIKQQLTLTPRLQQSVKLLQLSAWSSRIDRPLERSWS